MRIYFFSSFVLIVGMGLLVNLECAAGPAKTAASNRRAACQPAKIQRLFANEDGVYLLVLPLSGVEEGDAALGARASSELKERLPGWASREIDADTPKDMPRGQMKSAIEMLPCVVEKHEDAERVGRAAGATAVIWGRASCLLLDSAACSKLPLFWELPTQGGGSPSRESASLRLSWTVIRDRPVSAFSLAAPRALRAIDFELPSHDAAHAHALLDEAAAFYALRHAAFEPGLRLLQRARRFISDGAQGEALLDVLIGEVYSLLGKQAEARKAAENALAHCATENETCRFTSLYRLGMVEAQLGNTDKSIDRLTEALGLTEHLKDARGQRVILHSLATLQAEMGHLKPSIKLFERALAQSEAARDLEQQADDLRSLAYVYAHLGEVAQAEAYSEKALALYRRLGSPLGQVSVLNQLGLMYAARDLKERTDEVFGLALALARKSKLSDGESTILNNQAMVYKTRGDLGRAMANLQQVLALAEKTRDVKAQGTARSSLGAIYLEQGDLVAAEQQLAVAMTLRKQTHDRHGEAYTRRTLGHLRRRQGKRDEALGEYEKALRLHAMGGDPHAYGGLVLDVGQILMEQAKQDQAVAWFREALPHLEKQNLRDEEALVLMRLAEAYEAKGAIAEAIRTLEYALPKLTAPAARIHLRELLAGLGLLLAEAGRPAEAVHRYREAAALCTDPRERDTSFVLLGYALDLSLEHGDKASAERILAELRERDAPTEILLGLEAQLYGRTRSPEAEAKYQYMSYLGQSAGQSPNGQSFKLVGLAGLSRIHHAAAFHGCPGLMVMVVDQANLPIAIGDVVLKVQGQCMSGTAALQRVTRQAVKAAALKVELWRNDELLEVSLPGGKIPFMGSPF